MRKRLTIIGLALSSLCSALDDNLELLISQEELASKIAEVAQQINSDYADKNLTLVMIMKGSACVTIDLMRYLTVPFKLEYVKASSYGYNGSTNGALTLSGLNQVEIEGRDVLLIDDIFETGNTILKVTEALMEHHPKSIKTLLLLVKNIPRKTTYRPDYTLFEIENRFVIGYGLDYKELYRGLPAIYAFVNDTPPF